MRINLTAEYALLQNLAAEERKLDLLIERERSVIRVLQRRGSTADFAAALAKNMEQLSNEKYRLKKMALTLERICDVYGKCETNVADIFEQSIVRYPEIHAGTVRPVQQADAFLRL